MTNPILPDLYQPNSWEYNQWLYTQIWFGMDGYINKYLGGVIPNVDDTIIEYTGTETYQLYRVVSIDPTTKVPSLVPLSQTTGSDVGESELLYAGKGTGRVNDTFIMYLNPDILTLPAEVDARLIAKGSNTSYYRVFLGADISEDTGTVISVLYDSSNQPLSDTVPMELVDQTDPEKMLFRPKPFNFNQIVPEGELVTLVAYSDTNSRICFQPFTMAYNSTVMPVNPYVNYITGIRLESPYLSEVDNTTLVIPENFLNSSLLKVAYVDYKDGSSRKVNIGTGGMSLAGIDDIRGEWAGRSQPLVLKYVLDDAEAAMAIQTGGDKHLSKIYTVITEPADANYSVKLYLCPEWVNEVTGYKLRYWLLNLQRNIFKEVTALVKVGGSSTFDPTLYGTEQTIVNTLQLNDVDPNYPNFQYTQETHITLMDVPSELETSYLIEYNLNTGRKYGANLAFNFKKVEKDYFLTVDCGLTQPMDWLNELYAPLECQFDTNVTGTPPTPTHVTFTYLGESITYKWEDIWNVSIPWWSTTLPTNAQACYVTFSIEDAGGNKQALTQSNVYIYNDL